MNLYTLDLTDPRQVAHHTYAKITNDAVPDDFYGERVTYVVSADDEVDSARMWRRYSRQTGCISNEPGDTTERFWSREHALNESIRFFESDSRYRFGDELHLKTYDRLQDGNTLIAVNRNNPTPRDVFGR